MQLTTTIDLTIDPAAISRGRDPIPTEAQATSRRAVEPAIAGDRHVPIASASVDISVPLPPTLPCDDPPGSAPLPSVPFSTPSPDALRIQSARLSLVRSVNQYTTAHACSVSTACQALHISQSTYSRHAAALAAGGPEALLPGYHRCGRHSVIEQLVSPSDRAWLLQRLQLLNARTHHAATAATVLSRDPDCPPALAAYLQHTHRIPRSLLRAAHVTPEIRAKFDGPKAYQYAGTVSLRDMTEIMPDGTRRPIQPGDWWEFDDMSINVPFWYEIPQDSEDRSSTTPGVGLGRQGLYAIDLASGKWLGHLLVGRPRDSYRAEDILRFFHLIFQTHGKPRRGVRLERGSWYSHAVRGTKLSVPSSDDDILVSGLRSLGLEVIYAYTSHGKGLIESSFRHLQNLMAAEDLPNIGRHRGEGERATQQLLRAKAGTIHPAQAGFPHIDAASALVTRAETLANTTTKHGRLTHGIPDERWLASTTLHPLPVLTHDNHAAFLPERSELQIRSGCIHTQRDGQHYAYSSPDLFARLGNSYRLLVAFDPAEPALGAAIWNAETGSSNTAGWPIGHFLGWAQHIPLSPQFGRDPDPTARDARKAASNFHRTTYAGLCVGQPTPVISTLRDGKGNTVHITRDPASSVPSPAGASPRKSESPSSPSVPPCLRGEKSSPPLRASAPSREEQTVQTETLAPRIPTAEPESIPVERIYH